MKPSTWFRALAVVLGLFTLGHTVGTLNPITKDPREAAVINAMQGFRVPVMGFERTYWEFYRGFSISITILLAALAVIAWQIGTLSRRDPRAALPLAVTVLIACIAQAILCVTNFFTAPIVMTILAVICAAVGTLLLTRQKQTVV